MTELWLKFNDPAGGEKRVAVEKAKFVIGRHSANDLPILDGRLSREHVRIERVGDDFLAADLGSSNGTVLNGQPLEQPEKLKNGDSLVLGGLPVAVEIVSDQDEAEPRPPESTQQPESEASAASAAALPSAAAVPGTAKTAVSGPRPSAFPKALFLIAPLLGLIVIVFAVGIIFLLSGKKQTVIAENDDFQYSNLDTREEDDDSSGSNSNKDESEAKTVASEPVNEPTNSPAYPPDPPAGDTTSPSVPNGSGETAKVEQHAAAFLRRIAQNDPRAFLTGDQAKIVNAKLKQFSGSAAVADNIKSARKNSSQIKSIAQAKNLKPQFLAVAAITRLGGSRGDVVQTASNLAETYDKLGTQIGNELADDALLMVAAYDQGAAGDFMRMRNMLQDLANKSPESARAIRTIWFLEKNGKITAAEYERAVTFLAIGTITQNPKDFGVNAEALTL